MVLHPRLPVSPETRRRWTRRGSVPALASLAHKLLTGELGEISAAWRGWRIDRDGFLVSPEGEAWSVGRLTAWTFERQELELYRRRAANPEQARLF